MLIVWSDIFNIMLCYELDAYGKMTVGIYNAHLDVWEWSLSVFRNFDIVRNTYRYGDRIILDEAPKS